MRPTRFIPLFLLTLLLSACSVFRETLPTPAPTTVVTITAADAAKAMDEDRFWSTYGHNTLLVTGSVSGVDPEPGDFTITLDTGENTAVLCDLGNKTPPVRVGDSVTVRATDPEKDVQRADAGVFIQNCSLSS